MLGVQGGGIHSEAQEFDEEIIARRSRVLGYAIDARQQRFSDEASYRYQPFAEAQKVFSWNAQAKADIKDYNCDDLSI